MSEKAKEVGSVALPRPTSPEVEQARLVARVLDSAFVIPGINRTVGIDALIGLIPGFGDVLGTALSGYIIYLSARAGVPLAALLLMLGNAFADQVLGVIPILGDLFDFAFRANTRNVAILERCVAHRSDLVARSDRQVYRLAVLIGLALMMMVIASIIATAILIEWLLP